MAVDSSPLAVVLNPMAVEVEPLAVFPSPMAVEAQPLAILLSPMAIEFLPEAPFMYVADYSGSRILELRVETNGITRTCGIPANPVCLAVDGDMDTMLVGTTGATELLAVGGSGPIYKRTMSNYPALLAAQAIPNDTTLCLVFNGTDDHLSVLYHYFPPYGSPQLWVNLGNLPGDSHFLALNETGSRAFVLSPDQAGNSLLQSFDLDSLELLDSVTVPGFPMDLTCGEEAVFALTIE